MDRLQLSAIAHSDHPISAPLGDDSVRRLLDRALGRGGERLLDLGCAEATWLVRALTDRPGLRADGVDIDAATIITSRKAIAEAGLSDRLTLHAQDAKAFTSPDRYDVVLSVGATHAFGGLQPTLDAVRTHLAPGGTVLFGEGFWESEPNQTTLDAGYAVDEYDDLATTVDRITADGWTPVYGHVSTLQEWDDYELCWTGSLARWALDNADNPGSEAALEAAGAHRHTWLHGYRGALGFVTLLLRRTTQNSPVTPVAL